MSIFGKIASAIFGSAANAAPVTPDVVADVLKSATPAPAAPAPVAAAASAAAAAAKTPMAAVDVAAVMDAIAEDSDEDLDWRKSIVDLMKLLDIDSSLTARRELATELKYSGDMKDSAGMNVWLHKQVMTKLAENGGTVPKELRH